MGMPKCIVQFRNKKILKAIVLLLSIFFQACALSPVERSNRLADELGFEEQVLFSSKYRHRVYLENFNHTKKILHVYLEGDGMPWSSHRVIASDPTSRTPVMLPLMGMDKTPAIYLGRPCYSGFSNDPGCDPLLWTFSRYSQKVVDSMVEVIQQIIARYHFASVRLFGHSGGGTLAVLIAKNLPETQTVVTLAANLDVDAWTQYHRYTRLYDSLNPAKGEPLNPTIRQIHLQAGKDDIVPPQLAKNWFKQQRNSSVCLYRGFDHRCCWGEIWPKVLAWISGDNTVEAALNGEMSHHLSCIHRVAIRATPAMAIVVKP